MRFHNRYLIAAGAMLALTSVFITYDVPQAIGQPADVTVPSTQNPNTPPPSPLLADSLSTRENTDRALYRAAEEAYSASLAAFQAGTITDPEVVYRWSLRWMKAEDHQMKAEEIQGDIETPAAMQHLRRMTELVDLVARHPATKDGESPDNNLRRLAVDYYRAEAESLVANATAKPDKAASSSPDAAIEVAEAYLSAVLQGNTDAAAKLSAPGSLAASKRLMASFEDFAGAESLKIKAVQGGGEKAEVLIEEVPKAEGLSKAVFTTHLERKNGRWLVTTFAAYKAPARGQQSGKARPNTSPLLNRTSGNRLPASLPTWPQEPNTSPTETKIITLKHAKASELSTMISQLAFGPPNLVIAVDARTNRLIVRGPSGPMAEVEALIQQLDAPGPAETIDTVGEPSELRPALDTAR